MTVRTRLLVFSAPIALLMVAAIVKCLSVVFLGGSAVTDFTEGDTDALRRDAAALSVLNVAEPAKAPFAAGALAVLENRLDDADRGFSDALARTDHADSCPSRVNLVLVRETMGDRAAAAFDGATALDRYRSARELVEQAPDGCFGPNPDPDPQRRAVRADSAARLDAKIAAAGIAPPPAPPPPQGSAPPPPPAAGTTPEEPGATRRLNPGTGDPLDRLQDILRDAAP
ncbi:hypothetical protein ACWDTP_24080 [Mycobacterium sp. NPDC003449]